jgi:outer membrane murein-binding lipoprotein Lpp
MKQVYVAAIVAGGLVIAGCSGSDETNNNNSSAEAPAATLDAGEYEITAIVDSVRSTDGTTPGTALKAGAPAATSRTCVGPDNAIDPQAFAEKGESCTAGDTYMSGGRMSLQFRCNRAGKGMLSHLVDGKFRMDGFSGSVITTTIFSGSGDYELTRSVEAKRVGDCTPKAG